MKRDKLNKVISPIPTFNELILAMRRDYDEEEVEEYWREVYKWFKENRSIKIRLRIYLKVLDYSNVEKSG